MRSARSLARIVTAAAVSVALLAGCSQVSAHMGPGRAISTASMADVMFAQMMIPHHEQAVEMAGLAPTRSTDPQVLAMAAQIAAAQQPEIDLMKSWLTTWGVPIMADHSGHDMAGMMSDDDLDALESLTGTEFDEAFLTMMIAHHEGALSMVKPVLDSDDPAVKALAEAIAEVQTREIAQMRAMLAED
jgi:uncharacterized protein (DUF305 family)